MIRLKNGVNIDGIQPEAILGLVVVASIFDTLGHDCWVTSALDGEHGANSLHYRGLALDFRTRHLSKEDQERLEAAANNALGPQFDIILEETHLHMEHDPY